MAALAAAHDGFPHELFEYRDAAHGLWTLLPYYPGIVAAEDKWGGERLQLVANPLARAAQWPKLLALLRD